MLVTFVNARPRSGLTVAPPQLMAPELPGRNTVVPLGEAGVNGPAFSIFSSSQICLQVALASGESSVSVSREIVMRPSGGGPSVKGCVGDDFSLGTLLGATGRSS